MAIAAFVINPTLFRDPGRLVRQCSTAAQAGGWEPLFVSTAAAALAAGASLVFAAGGDGTVQACAQALAGTEVPLAIVPLGTANLTARALGVPRRPRHAIAAGLHGEDRRIDVARADGTVFTAMAGIGLDAAVVAGTRHPRKRLLGWLAYALSGAARLPSPSAEFTISLDDGVVLTRRARCVVVGNGGLLPGGFVLLPSARLDDGLLDVGILAPQGPVGWPRLAVQVLARRGVASWQARHVEISCTAELPREADGEILAPARSLTVSVWPGALTVRVPPPR